MSLEHISPLNGSNYFYLPLHFFPETIWRPFIFEEFTKWDAHEQRSAERSGSQELGVFWNLKIRFQTTAAGFQQIKFTNSKSL